jgi:methionine sulfoxide reductase catalytic subunit
MNILHRKPWALPERLVTPEHVFLNRRAFMGVAAAAFVPSRATAATDPRAASYPAPLNPKFKDAGRAITDEADNTSFNNFYEFGASKRIADAAEKLVTNPWGISIDGEVEAPVTLDFDDLIKRVAVEERVVRHRCVEAWAMVVPWSGFPLSQLVAIAKPKPDATYIRFETFNRPDEAPGQKAGLFTSYPWPYVEGLTMAEAMNDLAFMVTGAYGKPLPKSMGAPLRLHTPWKYGFKSIKSVVRISFTKERPVSFWEAINGGEYGFWANVNPDVPHPRWSQATEQMLGTGERVPTQLFNGYQEFVADLYKGKESEALFM